MNKKMDETYIDLYKDLVEKMDMGEGIYTCADTDKWIMHYLPESEWRQAKADFKSMQLAEVKFTEMMNGLEVQEAKEAYAEMLDTFSHKMLDTRKEGYGLEEQKGMMLDLILHAADLQKKNVEATELIEMANTPAEQLEEQTVDAVKETALEALSNIDVQKLKVEMGGIIGEVEDVQEILKGRKLSPAALSIATYLTNPKMRKSPEMIVAVSVASKKIADAMENLELPEDMDVPVLIEQAERGKLDWNKISEIVVKNFEILMYILLVVIVLMIILELLDEALLLGTPVWMEIIARVAIFVGVAGGVLWTVLLAAIVVYAVAEAVYDVFRLRKEKQHAKEVVEENAKKYEKIERTTEENQQEDEELEEEDEEAESYFSDARQSLADWCGENM